ncbi:hypothetical protein CVT26_002107 [Gymnopilus dilepis]|uniref:Uncharacterized protein n=1 Tax=Gymnopilus dilepis TaxID=231916 RepID=A0A409VEH9_9AGAR|nr:hypothetical protein CVT26_002107 [Gymnopilus dilepis]
MDFVQTLDPSKLVLAGTGLAFILSLGASPSYNFPLFLFGCYVQETSEATQSLQIFTTLLGLSTVFDIAWMMKNEQHSFFKVFTVVLLLLKIPTSLSFANALRQRGAQFGGLGSANLSGPTVWSMPGGFTSNGREGYQTVDDDSFVRNARPGASVSHKSAPSAEEVPAPGAYQSV